jgi:hypothetical protein
MLRVLDDVAHFLYCPAMLGRRAARARWYHNIHLIPGSWLGWVCDRYEARLSASCPNGFRCDHMSVSIGGDGRWVGVPEFGCGCKPITQS